MSIDDDSFDDMDAAAGAMAYQLELLEEANRIQWAEAEEEREKLRASEETLKELQYRVPTEQLELLRARQAGDAYEAMRIESEIESHALISRLGQLNKIWRMQADICLNARVDTEKAAETNSKHLQKLGSFRDNLAHQNKSILCAKVTAAREATTKVRDNIQEIQEDLDALLKSKADLTTSGEAFDQALNNVLLETKEEFAALNKANAAIPALQQDLEACERRSEVLQRQVRGEENAREALKKQASKKGVLSNAMVLSKRS